MNIKKYLILTIQLLISFTILFYLFKVILSENPNYKFGIIFDIDKFFYLILIIFTCYILNSIRLKIIVNNKISFLDILKVNIISSFFSNLNSVGSELIRVLMLKKKVKLISSFTYILSDRIIGITSKFMLIFISLLFIKKNNIIVITIVTLFIIFLIFFLFSKVIPFFIKKFKKFKFFRKYNFDENIFYEISKKKKLLILIIISLIAHIFQVLFIFIISVFYDNNILFMQSLLVGPVTMILSALPVSFGGWGVRELSMINGYSLFDIKADIALTISITIGLINLFVSFFLTLILFIINFINNLKI